MQVIAAHAARADVHVLERPGAVKRFVSQVGDSVRSRAQIIERDDRRAYARVRLIVALEPGASD